MRFPVSRRVLLTVGVSGGSLGLLSACGLRIDSDPDVPTLDSSQRLRNRIARILASASPASGDPETAGEDLATFSAAIGPEWTPPTGFATETPAPEDDRSFITAAEVVARAVFDEASQLGSGLIPVLSDVAIGMTLIAGEKRTELIRDVDELIRSAAEKSSAAAASDSSSSGPSEPGPGAKDGPASPDTDRESMFNTILNESRAAAYGYERLAVNFPAKSTARKGALARLESLGSLSGQMLEALGEEQADPNASAWRLDPTPTDDRSAKELALNLEDGVASAILPWLDGDTAAILRLWESARARTVFAAPQPLRFTYHSGQAEAQQ